MTPLTALIVFLLWVLTAMPLAVTRSKEIIDYLPPVSKAEFFQEENCRFVGQQIFDCKHAVKSVTLSALAACHRGTLYSIFAVKNLLTDKSTIFLLEKFCFSLVPKTL